MMLQYPILSPNRECSEIMPFMYENTMPPREKQVKFPEAELDPTIRVKYNKSELDFSALGIILDSYPDPNATQSSDT